MMTNSARYGTDHNFTANTMPFQVFVGEDNPTDEEAELGKPGYKIRADPKQDDTYVINRPSPDALDMPRMAEVVSQRGDSTRQTRSACSRCTPIIMQLLEKGYNPARSQGLNTKIGRAFVTFWNKCKSGSCGVTGKRLQCDVVASEGQDGVGGARRSEAGEAAGGSRLDPLARLSESQPHSVYGSERGDADTAAGKSRVLWVAS